jgi:hypothetical protein
MRLCLGLGPLAGPEKPLAATVSSQPNATECPLSEPEPARAAGRVEPEALKCAQLVTAGMGWHGCCGGRTVEGEALVRYINGEPA